VCASSDMLAWLVCGFRGGGALMFGSVICKVMWVGRATVFLVGLAVILALLFGVASTALGADGNPLILGKAANTASKITGLVKSGGGPALRLRVDSGAPLAVNSAAQVLNLNADYVDGRSASSFVANNTYRLGQGLERQGNLESGGKVLSQSCHSGDRLLSGGPASVNAASHVLDSFAADTSTWQVRINDSAVSGGDSFTVVVLCADQ
jgi:hypothetical protein